MQDDFIQIPLRMQWQPAVRKSVTARVKDRAIRCLNACRYARRRYRAVQWVTTGLTWGSIVGGFVGFLSGFEALAMVGAVIAGLSHGIDTWLLGAVESEYHRWLGS